MGRHLHRLHAWVSDHGRRVGQAACDQMGKLSPERRSGQLDFHVHVFHGL